MKSLIPLSLTTLRLLLGPVALACAICQWPRILFVLILVVATLSDIYDGVIARRLGVATPALRRYDSATDVIYYLFILYCVWLLCRPLMEAHWLGLTVLLASEAAILAISFVRFQVLPATHAYTSKFYGLCLMVVLIGLLAFDAPGWTLTSLIWIGLIANAEVMLIMCLSKQPPVDVASVWVLARR